ncbi:MAG TPA: hypothetical protein VIY08_11630 [Candidatus Nitrosocosmicus sp.]
MVKRLLESKEMPLFNVFFKSGIIIFFFGLTLILVDIIVHSFTEGLRFMGIDFFIVGILVIVIAYLYRYHKIIGFIITQLKMRIKGRDKTTNWYRP